jgi:flavorubredoxin
MTPTTKERAEQVAPGVVALGGWEPADERRISWLSAGSSGWLPINCYLVSEGDEGLLIDTGVAAHTDLVLSQLADAAAGLSRLSLFLSRFVEFDSAGNTAAILNSAPVDTLYAHFPDQDHVSGTPDEGIAWVRVTAALDGAELASGDFRCALIDEGSPIYVDEAQTRRIELHRAPLRLLLCTWTLDTATGTLFTSDAFGHGLIGDPHSVRVIDEDTDTTTVEDVRRGLEGKFGWLLDADPVSTRDDLASFFERHDVKAIAPAFGAVLRGQAVVDRHVAMVLDVLDQIAEEQHR